MASASIDQGPQKATEVRIRNQLYDVAGWSHPGGSILKFYMGSGDATESFDEFHQKSPKVAKMLTKFPSRPVPAGAAASVDAKEQARLAKLSADYRTWRQELIAEGWFDANYAHTIYRMVEIFAMHAIGLYMLVNTKYTLPALLILGIVQGRCGWLMHEGGHFSMFSITWLDKMLHEFFYGFGCGMSGGWWRSQHNRHHATPQKLQHDVDLDTMPLIAFHKKVIGKGAKNPFVRLWIPFQAYLFGPITTSLVAHFWQLYLHPRFIVIKKLYREAFFIALRYALIFYLAHTYAPTAWDAFKCYLLYDAFGGAYIFTNFALSHTHLPVVEKNDHKHWVEYAAEHTINITPHFFTNWWMGYLNFQIEHHLFPTMPQYKFIQLSPRTKKFFEAHGLKYDVRDYFAAMQDTFANLAEVGKSVNEAVRL